MDCDLPGQGGVLQGTSCGCHVIVGMQRHMHEWVGRSRHTLSKPFFVSLASECIWYHSYLLRNDLAKKRFCLGAEVLLLA